MIFDLQAHRCPDAISGLLRMLDNFITSQEETGLIISIEPALTRALEERITMLSLPVKVEKITTEDITQAHRDSWVKMFDDIDHSDVTIRTHYHLKRVTSEPTKVDTLNQ